MEERTNWNSNQARPTKVTQGKCDKIHERGHTAQKSGRECKEGGPEEIFYLSGQQLQEKETKTVEDDKAINY
jgi:hypothetical protein